MLVMIMCGVVHAYQVIPHLLLLTEHLQSTVIAHVLVNVLRSNPATAPLS